MTELTVVCVDPDAGDREATAEALADAGHAVVSCRSVADAVAHLDGGQESHPVGDRGDDDGSTDGGGQADGTAGVDCLVTEYDLPDGTGLDLATEVRERAPDTPCVLFTNAQSGRIETDRREDVVVEYLPKDMPESESSLVRLVENVVAQRTQVGYPLPPDEDERLATLSQYDRPGMDTAATFDRLTELARAQFGVDVAFVGLVDAHEERFLACSGADWETLDREDSMCTHTILEDEQFVVEDVADDPRFASNERLVELDIEAYAGVPLTSADGVAIGAFCLTHDQPRRFSETELANLRRFADETMEQLELRRRLVEADASVDTHTDGGPVLRRHDGAGGDGGNPL